MTFHYWVVGLDSTVLIDFILRGNGQVFLRKASEECVMMDVLFTLQMPLKALHLYIIAEMPCG